MSLFNEPPPQKEQSAQVLYQLPPGFEEECRKISPRAAETLGSLLDGNGLQASQVRFVKDKDIGIHQIPATMIVALHPDISRAQVHGNNPQGKVLGSDGDVGKEAEGLIPSFLEGADIQGVILEAMKKTSGNGFGADVPTIALRGARKEFSVVAACLKCGGTAAIGCPQCHASGMENCYTCRGQGYTPCQFCYGTGLVQDGHGGRVQCTHCQTTGKLPCSVCRGQKFMTCGQCQGRRQIGCQECQQSGYLTTIYQVAYKAQFRFDPDWQHILPEVRKVIDTLGLRALATEKHAHIEWLPPVVKDGKLLVPCVAFLPIAEAEFSIVGKVYPAVVAGLRGRIVKMDPVLDPAVKAGISALMKLSKGPLAVQALIDTACKYKMIRQVLAGLERSSKRAIHQSLAKEYPVILSDKYARATIIYAQQALAAISKGPRYKGLAAGTALAAAVAAGYYFTACRHVIYNMLAARGFGQHIVLADVLAWLIGAAASVYTIKFVTANAFRRLLPQSVQQASGGLPSAGPQGWMALGAAALVCLAAAALAPEKPAWILFLLKLHQGVPG